MLRHKAKANGLNLRIDSAGTGDWHIGSKPYGPMLKAARARGYELSMLRARQVSAEDFDRFDLILAMDADNLANLKRMKPAHGGAALHLFTDYAPQTGADHVPDPYYTRDFDGTLDLIETCAGGLISALSKPA